MSVTATVKWTDGLQFVGESGSQHAIVLDAASADGGANTGMRPIELLAIAIGSCSGMDIISILKKKRQNVHNLSVHVSGELAPDFPHRFVSIDIEWIITGNDVAESAVKHAVDLSMEKYCSVKATLEHSATISFRYKIINQ